MLRYMHTEFSDEFVKSVLLRYEIGFKNVHILAEHENVKLILEGYKGNKCCIVRIYIGDKNSETNTIAECEWIQYLGLNGISASRPVESKFGKIVEIETFANNSYVIVVFEKALGRHLNAQDYTMENFNRLGKTMGKIHKLSKNYLPLNPQIKRHQWSDSRYISWLKDIPKEQTLIIQKTNELVEMISTLPKDNNSYGMIHSDVHDGNYFIHNDDYTIFDFFDCEYGWFANDIAIAIFYSVPYGLRGIERTERAQNFYNGFINGYLKENSLSNFWIEKLPDFIKLREYIMYGLYTELTTNGFKLDFIDSFMKGRMESLENGVPYIDINFAI